jgi:FkbM family methyltransferase
MRASRLTPWQVREEIRRRLCNRALARAVTPSPTRLTRIGSDYGGALVALGGLGPGSICYSVGIGEDLSFDLELLSRTRCEIYAFDPTPRSVEFVRTHGPSGDRFHFFPYALSVRDGPQAFYVPRNAAHVSHSLTDQQRSGKAITVEGRTLRSIMTELGHGWVDLLKLDIEGAEYGVLSALADTVLPCDVLAVEFHGASQRRVRRTVDSLRNVGFPLAGAEGPAAVFVRSKGTRSLSD